MGVVSAVAAAVLPALPASAAAGETVWETGRAVYPSDGDTVWVCLDSRPSCTPSDKTTWTSVRLMSIQAMETVHDGRQSADAAAAGVQWVTTDQCHARDAEARLDQLVFGTSSVPRATWGQRVRLKSVRQGSSSYGRLRRTVEVQQGSRWVDVQQVLLQEGLALWMPLPAGLGENAHNAAYNLAAQQAAASWRGLWRTDSCRPGPAQSASLALDVKWNANGDDLTNVNGEWVRIRNTGSVAVDLNGWTLRTASWDMYRFTRSTVVAPGGSITVNSGRAPASPRPGHFYVGSSQPFYQNVDAATGLGGGAYLFDGDGDLRFHQTYACKAACPTNPGLAITAVAYDPAGDDAKNPNGEYVKIKNTSSRTVKLAPYLVAEGGSQYSFSAGAYLRAGETLTLRVGPGTNTHLTKHWGHSKGIFANTGGAVRLLTYDDVAMSCKAWKTGKC